MIYGYAGVSGKSRDFAAQLAALEAGEGLVVAEWDWATRSMWDGPQSIKAAIDSGASIKVLDRPYIDLETPMGRGFMAMMSAMAEDERLRIIKRTHEADSRSGLRSGFEADYRSSLLNPLMGRPASGGERSPRSAPARRKISSQAVESKPSRRKMAPPSVGSAGAPASAPATDRFLPLPQFKPTHPPRRRGA